MEKKLDTVVKQLVMNVGKIELFRKIGCFLNETLFLSVFLNFNPDFDCSRSELEFWFESFRCSVTISGTIRALDAKSKIWCVCGSDPS